MIWIPGSLEEFNVVFDEIASHKDRVVNNTKRAKFTLDTCRVSDRDWIYETAVCHEDFNNGAWIVLEGCSNKEEAWEIHQKWLDLLDKDDFDTLTDCYDDVIFNRQVMPALDMDTTLTIDMTGVE